jgi:hypothetical protein
MTAAFFVLLFLQLASCKTEILQVWPCKWSNSQKWMKTDEDPAILLASDSTKFVMQGTAVTDLETGLCADCSPYVEKRERRVDMKPCTESLSQQWTLNGETIHCVAIGKHMCLDMGSTPTCADAPFNKFPYWFENVRIDFFRLIFR